jgi:hypothetical protein
VRAPFQQAATDPRVACCENVKIIITRRIVLQPPLSEKGCKIIARATRGHKGAISSPPPIRAYPLESGWVFKTAGEE